MSKILVPTQALSDWRRLLTDPQKHWRAGYSAMATARSWEAAGGRLPTEIAAILSPEADLLFAIPEHKVPLPGGSRESQCDVFALVRALVGTIALAVEAKVHEPFDKTLGHWLQSGSSGKRQRLSAICALLGCPEPPPDLRYQLFHRTAAAIVEADRFYAGAAAMIVQSFSQEHRWFEDFAAFCGFLGLDAARGTPLVRKLPDGRDLILGWATGWTRLEPNVPSVQASNEARAETEPYDCIGEGNRVMAGEKTWPLTASGEDVFLHVIRRCAENKRAF